MFSGTSIEERTIGPIDILFVKTDWNVEDDIADAQSSVSVMGTFSEQSVLLVTGLIRSLSHPLRIGHAVCFYRQTASGEI